MNWRFPLPETYPQFSVLETHGYLEYRVENWRLSRDGSRKIIRRSTWSFFDCIWIFTLIHLWSQTADTRFHWFMFALSSAAFFWMKCCNVLHESVVVAAPNGIQLETHYGLYTLRLYVRRQFIPLQAFKDLLIHEGFQLWSIRYYLGVMRQSADGQLRLTIVFPNLLPYFPVLVEVSHGVRQRLLIKCDTSH